MTIIRTHKVVSAFVAIAICLSVITIGAGVALSSRAIAKTVDAAFDPQIGDYNKAQRDLEQHLDQRLRLHLAQAAKQASQR